MGLGTYYDFPWIIKSRMGIVGGADAKVAALKAGLDAGFRLIDTAEIYNSEPLVARAIKGFPKGGPVHSHQGDVPTPEAQSPCKIT